MHATPKRTIFISHASQNQAVAEELHQALTRRYHLDCWMDAFDLHGEKGTFSEQIVEALRSASVLVVVDSPAARSSDYVKREIQLGKDLQLPIRHCSIDENLPAWRRQLRIQRLALGIQLLQARLFIAAAVVLFLLMAALAGGVFWLGTQVVPALARPGNNLPAAFRPTPTHTAVPAPQDARLAAPFHFKPDTVLLQDVFEDPAFENNLNDQTMHFDITPRNAQVQVEQQNGSLVAYFPADCLDPDLTWDCELELDSDILDAGAIQYFGLRARTAERTALRDISVSVSINEPNRSRAGFGWDFTDHAVAFFRSVPALQEKDLYAYVRVDQGWHAYEIVRSSQTGQIDYYVDGQKVASGTPVHPETWNQAPLRLIIYSLGAWNKSVGERTPTRFEMDQVIIGGFTNP